MVKDIYFHCDPDSKTIDLRLSQTRLSEKRGNGRRANSRFGQQPGKT